ncbi:NADH-cytochrome b5 reductase [Globomyces sp. JEL0801]|nr:NADH-cytochrome b5 reductase [Globomyces sp. JEL0801]
MFRSSIRPFSSSSSSSKGPLFWLGVVGLPVAVGAVYYKLNTPKTPVPALVGEWRDFKLKEIIDINHNTKSFRFALPDGTTHLGLPTASCLMTKFQNGVKDDGKPVNVIRPYTPIEDPAVKDTGYFDLVVKKYPDGKMSKHIHEMKVGDTLEMKGPMVKYEYVPNKDKHIGMIAGGSGLTPMIQVIQRVISDPSDHTKLTLVFANETEEDILLKKYLDNVAETFPDKLKVHYVVTKPGKGWTQSSGFVNESIIKNFMPGPGSGKVFVCGPPGMMSAISGPKTKDFKQGEVGGLLKKLGYTENDIFKF